MVLMSTCPYCAMPTLEAGYGPDDPYTRCHFCGWVEAGSDDDHGEHDSDQFARLDNGPSYGSGGAFIRPG